METSEIQDRIAKNEIKIDKINRRIEKWDKAKSKEAFIKQNGWLYGGAKTWEDAVAFAEEKSLRSVDVGYEDYLRDCDAEIYRAKRDLEDTQNTIIKYKNMLNINAEKSNTPIYPIIKEFFDRWKIQIKDYIEMCKVRDKELKDELKGIDPYTQYDKYKEVRGRIKNLEFGWYGIYKQKLNDFDTFLDNYMRDRYVELINKVSAITGEITDVGDLRIGGKGELNGIVIGENGKAKVDTIIAGGYNQDTIVNVKHGQCAHYRTLVHKIN